MTGLGSTNCSPCRNIAPSPRQPKTDSVTTAPPSSEAKSKATIVVMGMSALRSACLVKTTRSESPLERAVRM